MDNKNGSDSFDYSCALCENRNDLRQECCCKASNEELVEVVEVRLLKRCHLLAGDRVCTKHYHKLKSGLIFGGKDRCCSPFHVGPLPGKLLRPVPRNWRQYFDSTDVISRYHPSLQLCADCYRVTFDIMLPSDHEVPRDDVANDVTGSSNSTYTSPRRWISSRSINGFETNSGSGSNWSLATPRGSPRVEINLLERYHAQKDSFKFPRPVPESVKRYFHSYPNFANSVKPDQQSSKVFESDNPSEDKRKDMRRTSSAVMRLQTTPTSQKETRMCSKLTDNSDTKSSKIELKMSPKSKDKPKIDRVIRRLSSTSSNASLSSQESYKSGVESTRNPNQRPENDLSGTVDLQSIASASNVTNDNREAFNETDKAKQLKMAHFQTPFSENKEKKIAELSNVITSQVISDAISFEKEEANSTRRINDFSSIIADEIVRFVTQKNDTNSVVKCEKLEDFSSRLTETILSKARSTMVQINTCEVCAGKIIKHCLEVVSYVNETVASIIEDAFESYRLEKHEQKLKLEKDLAEKIVKEILAAAIAEYNAELRHSDDAMSRGQTIEDRKTFENHDRESVIDDVTVAHVTKDDGGGTTRITWLRHKRKYRSVLTVNIPRYDVISCPPSTRTRTYKTEKSISVTSLDDDVAIQNFHPLQRSRSLNFAEDNIPEVKAMRRTKSLDSFFLVVVKPGDATYDDVREAITGTDSLEQDYIHPSGSDEERSESVATSNTEIVVGENSEIGNKSEYFAAKYSVDSDSECSSIFENTIDESVADNLAGTEPVSSIVSFQDDFKGLDQTQNKTEDTELVKGDSFAHSTTAEVDSSANKDTINRNAENISPPKDVNQTVNQTDDQSIDQGVNQKESSIITPTEQKDPPQLKNNTKNPPNKEVTPTSGAGNPRMRKHASQLDLGIDLSSLREEIAKLEQLPTPGGPESSDSEDEDERIHQRRRTQLLRAATDAEMIRNQKTPVTISPAPEKEDSSHQGESEDEDVSDVLAKAFERITPNLFMTSHSQASDNKIRVLALFGVSSVVLFVALFLFM